MGKRENEGKKERKEAKEREEGKEKTIPGFMSKPNINTACAYANYPLRQSPKI